MFIQVVAKALGDAMNQMVIGRALHEKPAACEEYFATDPPSKCLQLLQFRVRDELLRCIGCLTQRGVDGLCVRASAVGDEEIAILVLGQSAGQHEFVETAVISDEAGGGCDDGVNLGNMRDGRAELTGERAYSCAVGLDTDDADIAERNVL